VNPRHISLPQPPRRPQPRLTRVISTTSALFPSSPNHDSLYFQSLPHSSKKSIYPKPFAFCSLHTLYPKHRGWGYPPFSRSISDQARVNSFVLKHFSDPTKQPLKNDILPKKGRGVGSVYFSRVLQPLWDVQLFSCRPPGGGRRERQPRPAHYASSRTGEAGWKGSLGG
jgi:hypothetical protein